MTDVGACGLAVVLLFKPFSMTSVATALAASLTAEDFWDHRDDIRVYRGSE